MGVGLLWYLGLHPCPVERVGTDYVGRWSPPLSGFPIKVCAWATPQLWDVLWERSLNGASTVSATYGRLPRLHPRDRDLLGRWWTL
jgi:hypothetical protein